MNHALALAAIDLGSNSFRLEIGRYAQPQMQRVDYLKETIRQGNGLDAERNLTPEALERGWDCLARFGERLRGFAPDCVRAVATQTLREARNRALFVERGSALLGFPIEVITGEEEAALIYRGVVSQLPPTEEKRLVIDIGGRSTEFVRGTGCAAQAVASYRVGSVAWSARYFPQGALTANAFAHAQLAAQAVLDAALDTFAPGSWDVAYASAGTANAVGDMLCANGQGHGVITRDGLHWLQQQLLRAGHVDRIALPGLKEERRPIVAGGLSVLMAVFDLLGLERMHIAQGALRMGVLFGLLDRHSEDAASASVRDMLQRFGANPLQAEHVAANAQWLWSGLHAAGHSMPRPLDWAARLHAVGRCIAPDDHAPHSAYLAAHCPLPGVDAAERAQLVQLLLQQSGPLPSLAAHGAAPAAMLLCLRLAVLLGEVHATTGPTPALRLSQLSGAWQLELAAAWCTRHPHLVERLHAEARRWNAASPTHALQLHTTALGDCSSL